MLTPLNKLELLRNPSDWEIHLISGFRQKCTHFRRGVFHMRKVLYKRNLEGSLSEGETVAAIVNHANQLYQCMTDGKYGDVLNPPSQIAQDMKNFVSTLVAGQKKEHYETYFDYGIRKLVYANRDYPKP